MGNKKKFYDSGHEYEYTMAEETINLTPLRTTLSADDYSVIAAVPYPAPTVSLSPTNYKYNEDESIKEIQSYIAATYDQHYSRNKFQATEFIIDAGHGTGFNIGNMMKYTQRYGRKGDPAEWRKDLMKVIHYAIMQLHVHDTEHKD